MQLVAANWQMIGSLADWSTAVIALGAFIVAGIAARYTSLTISAQQKTLELQRLQYEAAQNQVRRTQAEKVTFWMDYTTSPYQAMILNASDSPIYDVGIFVSPWAGQNIQRVGHVPVLLPSNGTPTEVDCVVDADKDNDLLSWTFVTRHPGPGLGMKLDSSFSWTRSSLSRCDPLVDRPVARRR